MFFLHWLCYKCVHVYNCCCVHNFVGVQVQKIIFWYTHIQRYFQTKLKKNSWFKWSICQVCRYHYQQKNIFISTSTSIQTYSFLIKRFIIHMYTGIQTSTRKLYKILSTCKFYEVSVIGRQHLLIQPPNVTLFFSVCNVDTLNHKK